MDARAGALLFPGPESHQRHPGGFAGTLGVALHAVDLAKLRAAHSVAILGAGSIGLFILQVARLAGADPIFVTDKFPWRLKVARRYGATGHQLRSGRPRCAH